MIDCFLVTVKCRGYLDVHVMGHAHVDMSCRMNHREIEIVFFGNMLEIEGVQRDAVTTDTGTGIESLETKWFGFGCFYYLPYINVHFARQECQLIDKADIDKTIGVF